MKKRMINFIWWLQGHLPKRGRCGMCDQPFLAWPTGNGEYKDYCSAKCQMIQGQIDGYLDYREREHERGMMARGEHPSKL